MVLDYNDSGGFLEVAYLWIHQSIKISAEHPGQVQAIISIIGEQGCLRLREPWMNSIKPL